MLSTELQDRDTEARAPSGVDEGDGRRREVPTWVILPILALGACGLRLVEELMRRNGVQPLGIKPKYVSIGIAVFCILSVFVGGVMEYHLRQSASSAVRRTAKTLHVLLNLGALLWVILALAAAGGFIYAQVKGIDSRQFFGLPERQPSE